MIQEFEGNNPFLTGEETYRYSLFDPFNHGTTTVDFQDMEQARFAHLSAILRNGWDISEIESIAQVWEGAEKSSNNFRVVTKYRNYLLKESHINDPQIQNLVNRCLMHCEADGIPVPHILPTVEGETFIVSGKIYRVDSFIQGEHYNGSREELQEVASNLALLHKSLASSPFSQEVIDIKGILARHDWQELDSLVDLIKRGSEESGFDSYVKRVINEVQRESQTIRGAHLEDLPRQIIHRDVHPHNLLFDPDSKKLVAFLDFDPIIFSQRIRDVAFAMHRLARTYGEMTESRKDVGVDIRKRAKLFLRTYMALNHLTDEEVNAIPLIIKDEELKRIIDTLAGHYVHGNQVWDFDLTKHITLLKEAEVFKTT